MTTYAALTVFPAAFLASGSGRLASGTLVVRDAVSDALVNIYSDTSGTSAGNTITLNARGEPTVSGNVVNLYGINGAKYKFTLFDAGGSTIWSVDNVLCGSASDTSIKPFDTVAEAQADAYLVSGGVICIAARASSLWDLSSSGVANGYNVLSLPASGLYATLRVENGLLVPMAFGAKADGSSDDYGAINAMITYATAMLTPGNVRPTFDFGDSKYRCSAPLEFNDFDYCEIKGSFRVTTTHSSDYAVKFVNCDFLRIDGIPQFRCGSSAHSGRQNLFGVVFHNSSRCMGQGIEVEGTKADGIRFTGTSAMGTFGFLRGRYCGAGRVDGGYATIGAPTATFTSPVQSGSTNSTNQRSTLTMSSIPQHLKDYIDYGVSEGLSAAYIRVNGKIHMIKSYSGSDIVVWPWVDPSDAGSVTQYIYGAGAYFLGTDVSCPEISMVDSITCGIGIAANSLYPPSVQTAVLQANGVALLQGNDLTAASEELLIGKLYVEINDVDILMSSQALTPLTVNQIVAPNYSKIKQLWSNNGSSVQVRTQLTEFVLGDNGRIYKDQYAFQLATSNQQSLRIYDDRPLTLASNTASVLLVDDDDRYNAFGQRNNFVYWYANTNGMTPTGSITFTPPSGGTINGKAVNATQVFNAATGPQCFMVSRSASLTYFIEPLAPSTVTKV